MKLFKPARGSFKSSTVKMPKVSVRSSKTPRVSNKITAIKLAKVKSLGKAKTTRIKL